MAFTGDLGSPTLGSVELGAAGGTSASPPPPGGTNAFAKPEVTFGPAIPGAPWATRRLPQRYGDSPAPPIPGPPGGGNTFAKPSVTFGPAVPGAPWSGRNYVEPHPGQRSPGGNPPGPAPVIAGLPLLERVPDISGPDGLNRLRRHTEKLSSIINSLVSQGILVQTGPASWTINLSKASGSGYTGPS